jgi:hypothetical protein
LGCACGEHHGQNHQKTKLNFHYHPEPQPALPVPEPVTLRVSANAQFPARSWRTLSEDDFVLIKVPGSARPPAGTGHFAKRFRILQNLAADFVAGCKGLAAGNGESRG